MSAAGAAAAIRHSMAVGEAGNRASSFSFGVIRPTSEYPADGGQAGIGASREVPEADITDGETSPQMAQVRRPRPSTSGCSNPC